jgi:hypothetical protein
MKKFLLSLLALILVSVIGGFLYLYFSLNTLVKKAVETIGPAITRTDVTLASANLSPFSGNGSLSGFEVGNPKEYTAPYALKLGSIKVSVDKASILNNPIIVNSIEIRDPRIVLIGTPAGTNLQQIMRNIRSYDAPKKKPAANTEGESRNTSPTRGSSNSGRKFIVKSVVISGASLDVGLSAFGQSVHQTLPLPEIKLSDLGSAGKGISEKELAEQILTPLINAGIDEGIKAASKQGLIQLQQNGGKELGNLIKGLFK